MIYLVYNDYYEYELPPLRSSKALLAAIRALGGTKLPDTLKLEINLHASVGEDEGGTYTPDEDGMIEVEIFACKDLALTLAHELVHVAQIILGLPLCEVQAYGLEQQIKEVLLNEIN